MTKENPSERIKNIITGLVFKDDYWGYLFSRVNRRNDETLPSPMGVCPEIDGTITLLYNENYINLMDEEFLGVVIEHEGTHLLNNHIPRLLKIIANEVNEVEKSRKIKKCNLAADCAVNSIINIKKSYMLGSEKFEIVHPDIYNLPTRQILEYYYVNIPDEKNKSKRTGSGDRLIVSEDSEEISNSNGLGNIKNIDDHGSWMKNISKVSDISSLASRVEQYTEQILEDSYNNVRRKGNLPGHIVDRINQLFKPPQIPYYQIIKKLMKGSRLTKYKKAYTRINKKRVYSFFIEDKKLPIISPFPGKTKDYSFNITTILDSSGSMSKDDILEGLSGIKNFIENDKDCLTTVLEIDTIIQKEYKVKKIRDIQFDIKGRGGTNLSPALIRSKELNTDVTIVFTDGFCEDINSLNRLLFPQKIIYVLTNNGSTKNIDRTGYIVRLPK